MFFCLDGPNAPRCCWCGSRWAALMDALLCLLIATTMQRRACLHKRELVGHVGLLGKKTGCCIFAETKKSKSFHPQLVPLVEQPWKGKRAACSQLANSTHPRTVPYSRQNQFFVLRVSSFCFLLFYFLVRLVVFLFKGCVTHKGALALSLFLSFSLSLSLPSSTRHTASCVLVGRQSCAGTLPN